MWPLYPIPGVTSLDALWVNVHRAMTRATVDLTSRGACPAASPSPVACSRVSQPAPTLCHRSPLHGCQSTVPRPGPEPHSPRLAPADLQARRRRLCRHRSSLSHLARASRSGPLWPDGNRASASLQQAAPRGISCHVPQSPATCDNTGHTSDTERAADSTHSVELKPISRRAGPSFAASTMSATACTPSSTIRGRTDPRCLRRARGR